MLPPLYHSVSRCLADYFYHKLVRSTNDGLSCVGYLSCMNTGLIRAICDRHPNASLTNGYGISAVFCFYLKGILLIGERSEIVFISLPFLYISAEFSPLFPPVRKINIRQAAITAAKLPPIWDSFFLPLPHSLFTVYLLLWVYHSRSFSSRQTASVWFFVLKYYTKVTIRYKISYSCNIAVIFTEKAEKLSKIYQNILIHYWFLNGVC